MDKGATAACIVLIDEAGDIIAQLRDNKPGINSPGNLSGFGGYAEKGETPIETMVRELHEETNVRLGPEDFELFKVEHHQQEDVAVFMAKGVSTDGFKVYEGQGYELVHDATDPRLTPLLKHVAQKWFKERDRILNATAGQPDVHRYAAVFFVGPDGTLYGQLRDDKPGIDQPGKIGAFGGACEPGETPLQTAVRELHEETDRKWRPDDLELFSHYVVWRPLTREYEQANVYLARTIDPAGMKVFEGQGVAPIFAPDGRIAVAVLPAVRVWFAA